MSPAFVLLANAVILESPAPGRTLKGLKNFFVCLLVCLFLFCLQQREEGKREENEYDAILHWLLNAEILLCFRFCFHKNTSPLLIQATLADINSFYRLPVTRRIILVAVSLFVFLVESYCLIINKYWATNSTCL